MSHNRELPAQQMADLRSSVVGDLRALADSDVESGGEDVLRDASSRLRRLLLDGGGTLMRFRRALGLRGEPRVEWFELAAPGEGLTFAQAGGATRGGMTVAGIQMWNRSFSEEEIRERYEAGKNAMLPDAARPMSTRRARLSEWLSSKCMVVGVVSVSRRDVVQFVANKLGGVHLDSTRNPTKQPGYVALDAARSTIGTMDLDAVYTELASITQDFLASRDVRSLFLDE